MSLVAFDLNDSGIIAADESKALSSPNPGVALIEGGSVVLGTEAARRARIKPRRIHDRFWQQLDEKPLRRPFPADLSNADLVYAHLGQIWKELGSTADSAVLAVPGEFSGHQLGLVLGIARACRIPASGMVDQAAAAVADMRSAGDILHLDLRLHCTVLTVLHRDTGLVRRSVHVMDRFGASELNDLWAKHIAGRFLRTTRFDPLHLAETEQVLFDQLSAWLRELDRVDKTTVSMEAGGRHHSIELSSRDLASAATVQYDQLIELVSGVLSSANTPTLALSHRIAFLPGLQPALATLAVASIETLPVGAAVLGALRHAEKIISPGDSLPFVTDLRLTKNAAVDPGPVTDPSSDSPTPTPASPPTHVLYAGVAHEITGDPLFVGVSVPTGRRGFNLRGETAGISRSHCSIFRSSGDVLVEDHSSYGTYVNGQRVAGTAGLTVGDRLRLGTPGIELELISVAE